MPLYRVASDGLERVAPTTFSEEQIKERGDLQRLLRADIGVLAPDLMVVAEEFGDWEDSRRRIDLLCLDRSAKLVVVELKRTDDGGHMELQALRYAAMVSSMTFEQLVAAHARQLGGNDAHVRAERALLDFLGWTAASESRLAPDVRIILVAADFSVELTTAVLWLNRQGLDLTCYRMVPHRLEQHVLVDLNQLIPLPEAGDYETKLRAQQDEVRRAESGRAEMFRRFWAGLIARARGHTQVLAGRSTSSTSWIAGNSGRPGLHFNFVANREASRVELYIRLGEAERTMTLFRQLAGHRAEVDERFGAALSWQGLPDRQGCRIAADVPGGWSTPEEQWSELQERLVLAMGKLEAALRPELERAL